MKYEITTQTDALDIQNNNKNSSIKHLYLSTWQCSTSKAEDDSKSDPKLNFV